jgi:hypothetical protein
MKYGPNSPDAEIPDPADAQTYYPYQHYAASEFLRNVVPTRCLAHLRFLELVFPPYVPHGWPLDEHPATQDWSATIAWLRDKINGPALTIRLIMLDGLESREMEGRDWPRRKRHGRRILRGYTSIVAPLQTLVIKADNPPAALYIRPGYDWHWPQLRIRYPKDGVCKPEPRESSWQTWMNLPYY